MAPNVLSALIGLYADPRIQPATRETITSLCSAINTMKDEDFVLINESAEYLAEIERENLSSQDAFDAVIALLTAVKKWAKAKTRRREEMAKAEAERLEAQAKAPKTSKKTYHKQAK